MEHRDNSITEIPMNIGENGFAVVSHIHLTVRLSKSE
jgi:hypothetical protein